MKYQLKAIATIVLIFFSVPTIAWAKNLEIQIVTSIEEPDCQSGMKSTQTIKVNTKTSDVKTSHETGTTSILGCEFPSIKDRFVIEGLIQTPTGFSFKAVGQTATVASLGLGGEIDYLISFNFDTVSKTLTISGEHDGYPTYYVKVGTTVIYQFNQTNMSTLLGDLDIKITSKTVKY